MKNTRTLRIRRDAERLARSCGWLLVGLTVGREVWCGSTPLIGPGAVWKYDDTGTDRGTAWREPAYNDSGWASGPAQLGYGDNDEATTLASSPVHPCYYFRHAFTVANPSLFSSLSLEVLRDDGCVVYLNGQEVARYNMPAGTISYSTWASGASEYSWDPPLRTDNLLMPAPAVNVIAVEVHQGSSTSSDISLDLRLTGVTAITIALDSPAADAANVSRPATLAATATDPEGDPLTLSFYGRPTPPPVPDFTLVVLPDTQFYTDEINGATKEMFIGQTQWIVANREARNIVYVAHVGDVSNNGDSYEDEWINADNALYRLESPLAPLFPDGIPFGVAVGNHDQRVPTGDTEPTTFYNQYFGVTRFQNRSYYGGNYGTLNNNQYQSFSASGLDFIVIYLEYDSTPDAAVLDWADALLKAYPNRRGIVVTHYLIETTGAWGVQGQAIYNALRDNPNLFLMLCGHNHGEARRTDVFAGNVAHTLLADYQDYANGGNGFLRLLEFSPNNNQIRVKTYSPWLNQFETDDSSQFTLACPMTSGTGFDLVQPPVSVPSGTPASVVWSGLQMGTEYEWFVSATDGADVTTSEVRAFTTASSTPPTVAIVSPAAGAVFPADPASVTLTAAASDSDGSVTSIEFFSGSTSLGSDPSGPFEVTATLGFGLHVLTAVATDNTGAQTVSAPVSITVGTAPAAPTDLTATTQSSTTILLAWTDTSANESGFEVYQSLSGGTFTLAGSVGPNVTSAWVTGLIPSTAYDFVVRAINALGVADSAPASATTFATPPKPAAPSGLTAAPLSGSEIALAWVDNATDESSFQVERSLDGSTWTALATLPANTTAAIDRGLTSGTIYYYRVLACNAGGCSAPSALSAAAPFIYSCATTETLLAGTLSGSRTDTVADDGVYEQLTERLSGGKPAVRYSLLEHKWTFAVPPGRNIVLFLQAHRTSSSDDDRFVFAYSTDDVTYENALAVSATSDQGQYQSFVLPNTLQGTVYVRVVDTDRTVGRVVLDTLYVDHLVIRTDVSPILTPPAAPTLTQAAPGDGTVALLWTASSGAISYSVWRGPVGGAYTAIATDITGTTYADSAAVNGTTYEYVVTAVNTYGESTYSNPLSATPQEPAVTAPPTGLSATGAKKKINLAWTQSTSPGVTANKVYRSVNGSTYELRATLPAATAYADAVPSGNAYYYVVTAVSSAGESAASNVAFATGR